MQKVILNFTETLKYSRVVTVLLPDGMTEKQLNESIDRALTRSANVDDVVSVLQKYNITLAEPYDSSLDSPDDTEVDCDDYDFVDEG
ncbi:hypothetical protein ABEX47_03255 [Paenibacillus ehimensis]|uniref:hypothetical protein n=1 Tax=Paenibacillus ehimensis TaxID=79264 RepID=UPI003D28CE7A